MKACQDTASYILFLVTYLNSFPCDQCFYVYNVVIYIFTKIPRELNYVANKYYYYY